MLNYQKLIIFCVLFIAIWTQSSNAATPEQKEEIDYLEESLIRAKENEFIPEDGINHFVSWARWKKINDDEKHRIALNYFIELAKSGLDFDSGTDDQSMNDLAKLAYTALDHYVKEELEDIEKHFAHCPATVKAIKNVAKHGQYLDFVAYFCEQIEKEIVQKAAESFEKTIKYPSIREIWAVLPPYLAFVSRVHVDWITSN